MRRRGTEACRGVQNAPSGTVQRGCGEAGPPPPRLRGGLSILAARGGRGSALPASASWRAAPERGGEPRSAGSGTPGPRQVASLARGPQGRRGDAGCVAQVAAGRGEAAAQRYRAWRSGARGSPAACAAAGRQHLGLDGGRAQGPGAPPAQASPPLPAPPRPACPCFTLTLRLPALLDFSSTLFV